MTAALKMTLTEIKLFLREMPTVFCTFAFPLIMLFIFGSAVAGDTIVVESSVRSEIGMMVMGYVGLMIAITGLSTMPTTIAAYRERSILRRMGATPVHPSVIVGSQIGVQMVMTGLGVVLLIAVGILFLDLKIPTAPLIVIPGLVLGGLSLFAVGYIIAVVIPTLRAGQAVGQALFLPMIFLSGATFPREAMPEALRMVGDFLPLTHAIILAQDLWFDQSWNLVSLAVRLGVLIVGAVIRPRIFR